MPHSVVLKCGLILDHLRQLGTLSDSQPLPHPFPELETACRSFSHHFQSHSLDDPIDAKLSDLEFASLSPALEQVHTLLARCLRELAPPSSSPSSIPLTNHTLPPSKSFHIALDFSQLTHIEQLITELSERVNLPDSHTPTAASLTDPSHTDPDLLDNRARGGRLLTTLSDADADVSEKEIHVMFNKSDSDDEVVSLSEHPRLPPQHVHDSHPVESPIVMTWLGKAGAGKSTLLASWKTGSAREALEHYQPTQGVEFHSLSMSVQRSAAKLQVWEMGDNPRYAHLWAQVYLAMSQVVVLVLDVCDPDAIHDIETRFVPILEQALTAPPRAGLAMLPPPAGAPHTDQDPDSLMEDISIQASPTPPQLPPKHVMLVGNKLDQSDQRQLSRASLEAFAQRLARQLHLPEVLYFETSAYRHETVVKICDTAAERVLASRFLRLVEEMRREKMAAEDAEEQLLDAGFDPSQTWWRQHFRDFRSRDELDDDDFELDYTNRRPMLSFYQTGGQDDMRAQNAHHNEPKRTETGKEKNKTQPDRSCCIVS